MASMTDSKSPSEAQRYFRVLDSLPEYLKGSSYSRAFGRLTMTVSFAVVSIHALSICPTFAVPLCWAFVAAAFTFLYEIGHDCSLNRFFPSRTANGLVGQLFLMPLLQPLAFWQQPQEDCASGDNKSKKESRKTAKPIKDKEEEDSVPVTAQTCHQWGGLCDSTSQVGVGHILVALSSAVFFPWLLIREGWWFVIKMWLIPFALFQVWINYFVSQGQLVGLSNALASCYGFLSSATPAGLRGSGSYLTQQLHRASLEFRLRSHLRFYLHVPSYRLTEAMDVVRRTWDRVSLDKSDTDVFEPSVGALFNASGEQKSSSPEDGQAKTHNPYYKDDTLAWGAFVRGLTSVGVAESFLSLLLRIVLVLWVCIYALHVQGYGGTMIETDAILPSVNGSAPIASATAFPCTAGEDRTCPLPTSASHSWLSTLPYQGWVELSKLTQTAAHEIHGLAGQLSEKTFALSYRLLVTSPHSLLNTVIFLALVAHLCITFVKYLRSQRKVWMLDFVTFTPPDEMSVTQEDFRILQRRVPTFTQQSLEFMDRLVARTGLGDKTYFPPGINPRSDVDTSLPMARKEAELVMYSCLDQLFATTGISPKSVDILVVNCSLFCPTPSLTAMIVNKYKMREDIQSYNLGGMGCSAGVIAVHLAKDLLQTYRNSLAVVVSTENITQNWYKGNERGMLISNTLFRMGGAAVMLTNKSSEKARCKYELQHSIRTHRGSDDQSYQAVWQDVDAEHYTGVRLSKGLMGVAGEALKRNITNLGPLILPWTEQLRYLYSLVKRKWLKAGGKPYVPNFKKAVQHFCIHAGGRAVVEAIEEALSLNEYDVAPSKAVLRRYGNTSSSSIWYELAYMEKQGRIKRHDKVWQIAFGSGFKCNSAVWKAL